MKISYINFYRQWIEERNYLDKIFRNIFSKGVFVGGSSIDKFEKNLARYCKIKYCVSLNSGTDALLLGMKLLGVKKGDEVITPPNSFFSSTSSIVHLGARPVFADILPDQSINPYEIKKKITKKTKAIMPVHLTGRVCNMTEIKKISEEYKIPIIEDAAQSIGSKYKKKFSGTFGEIGCFSAHPLKNLNASGDAGFMVTNNKKFYLMAKSLSNHGSVTRDKYKHFGYLSRMDTLQAEILNFRLKKISQIIKKRRANANYYFENIKNSLILLEKEKKDEFNTYHTFVVKIKKKRKQFIDYLFNKGIETRIHYPTPIHLQPASKRLGYLKGDFPETERQSEQILTLPINQFLKKEELEYICWNINNFNC